MKSERRHELQHNALLDWLTETGMSIKPYASGILLGIVVVLAGLAAYKWMSIQSSRKEAMAWNEAYSALGQNDAAALDQAAEDYPNTTAAQWAAVIAADLQLSQGCQDLFTTKATAADQFQKAIEKYTGVLGKARAPEIRERATFGLARTYEAMAGTRQSKQELESAKGEYEKIVQQWPDGAYAKAAKARLQALKRSSTLEFYDALAAWEPRPAIASPAGLDNLNIPFDESGKGLDVGESPKRHFGDIIDNIEKASPSPAPAAPGDGAAEPGKEPASADAPAMPAATGDLSAKPEAPALPSATGQQPAATEPAGDPAAGDPPAGSPPAEKPAEKTDPPAK